MGYTLSSLLRKMITDFDSNFCGWSGYIIPLQTMRDLLYWKLQAGVLSTVSGGVGKRSEHYCVHCEPLARSRACLFEALLIYIGSSHAELQIFILCPARAGHWQSMWCNESSSCSHFLHMTLSERPVTCRYCLNLHWPVKNPVTSRDSFLSKASWFLRSPSKALQWRALTVSHGVAAQYSECFFVCHSLISSLRWFDSQWGHWIFQLT
jgi:hypothetical protein